MKRATSFSKTDLMYEISYNSKFVPEKSPRVSVKTTTDRGRVNYLMHNQDTGNYYDLDEASKAVWDLIDARRTTQQITHEVKTSGTVREQDEVLETLLFFAESQALVSEGDPIIEKRVEVISSFETRVILIRDARKFLGVVHKILRPILRRSLFWLSMMLVIIGAILFAPRFGSIFADATNFQIAGSVVVGFFFYQFILLAPVTVLHELSHGLALVHYGGRAREIGTGMFYFGPMFYVNATDSWSLSRGRRIMIMWAGNLTTVLVGAIIVLVGIFVRYPDWIATPLYVSAFWCFYETLWQLAPPFETDGYYMLTDILNMPDLRRDGFAYFKSVIFRLFGASSPEPEGLTDRKRAILLGYTIFSISFVIYLAALSLRFTSYMARDAFSWAGRIWAGVSAGSVLSLSTYVVGLVSMSYFALTVSGYGVLVGSQLKRTLAGTRRFDALHDRDLVVFLYVPTGSPSRYAKKLERKLRTVASGITSNFSAGRVGPVLYANLRIGAARVSLSELGTHLRRIEDRFYRAYQRFVRSTVKHFVSRPTNAVSFSGLLREMARNTSPGMRSEARGVLEEYLERQERNARSLLSSTFSTAWTVEVPPAQEFELLESLFPSLLVSDLAMTNLVEETEEFKKQIIYGLDSIAELAEKGFRAREDALARPQEFQLISSFEPVRGRITFIGRTERIKEDLKELGPLFMIQVWAGYFDNLTSDLNLTLHSVEQSLAAVPIDLTLLADGEISYLETCISQIRNFEERILKTLQSYQGMIKLCKAKLERLKTIFEPETKAKIGLFNAVLALNHENLSSLPSRAKETFRLSERIFGWAEALKEPMEKEKGKRDTAYSARRKRLLWSYAAVGSASTVLLALSLIITESPLGLFLLGAFVSTQGISLLAYLRLWRSARRVPHYPSVTFTQTLTPIYAVAQAFYRLVLASEIMNPGEFLVETEKDMKKDGELRPEAEARPK